MIPIFNSNVSIIGNKVGVDKTGLVDLGNGRQGVHFNDGTNITVGGSSLAERNIISGNGSEGIGIEGLVNDVASADLKIINNYIGVNINGDAAIANDNYGISRWFSTASALIQDNIIAGNNSGGIYTLDAGTRPMKVRLSVTILGWMRQGKAVFRITVQV